MTAIDIDNVVALFFESLEDFLRVANMGMDTIFLSGRADVVKVSLFKIIDSFPLGRRTLLVNWRVMLKKRVSQKHSVRRINRKILTNDFLLVIVTSKEM